MKEEKKDLSSLVMMRERKKGVREVVQKCMRVAKRGSVANQTSVSSPFPELVLLCLKAVEDSTKSEEIYSQITRFDKIGNNKNNHDNSSSNYNNYHNDHHDNFEDVSRNQKENDVHNENESVQVSRNNGEKNGHHAKDRDEQILQERNRRSWLAQKLLEHPATYIAVLEILGSLWQSSFE